MTKAGQKNATVAAGGLDVLPDGREKHASALDMTDGSCLTEKLAGLEALRACNRLIKVGYGYSPKSRDWQNTPFISDLVTRMKHDEERYLKWLRNFSCYIPYFKSIALNESDCADESQPFWLNDWMPGFDAITLYGMVARLNPRYYVEVGSGNSTKFVRRAIRDHKLRTRIISIDPSPRSEIDDICDEIIRKPCEDIGADFFRTLSGDDIVFIDNSHISFMNSDVTVFFCEILGNLPKSLVFGLHDIYLPFDYPDIWKDRWYNEQYLLLMYLAGGAQGDKIILPNYYLSHRPESQQDLEPFFSAPPFDRVQRHGGIFWMQKNG